MIEKLRFQKIKKAGKETIDFVKILTLFTKSPYPISYIQYAE